MTRGGYCTRLLAVNGDLRCGDFAQHLLLDVLGKQQDALLMT
jgi:hypothetical protein